MIIDEIIAAASAEAAALLGSELDERVAAFAKLHATALCTRLGFAGEVDDDTARILALAAGRQTAASLVAAGGGFAGRIKVGDLEIEGGSTAETALALERSAEALTRLIGGSPRRRIVAVGGGDA